MDIQGNTTPDNIVSSRHSQTNDSSVTSVDLKAIGKQHSIWVNQRVQSKSISGWPLYSLAPQIDTTSGFRLIAASGMSVFVLSIGWCLITLCAKITCINFV